MSKYIWILLAVFLAFTGSCTKKMGPMTREEAERIERESAFPDMSFESQSPKRRASLQLTQEGYHAASRGMYAGASKKFEQAIDLDPSNPYAYFHYGVARLGSKEYNQSLRLLDEARDKFGDNFKWQSKIFNYQGLDYEAMGNIDMARECFKKASELDSRNEEAKGNLLRIGEK